MKTFSLTLFTLTSADVSLLNGQNKNEQHQLHNNVHRQYSPGDIHNPMRITQPSFYYLPQSRQSPPQLKASLLLLRQQQQLPMPSNLQPPLPIKPHRRPRLRIKTPKKSVVTKSFFIHSAPEESEEDIQEELHELAEQQRKHYNVLFVKAPAQTSKAAAANLAQTIKEEKTVVYVLSKKTSAAELQEAIKEIPPNINKPQVFFIKYRTPEEAAHAQHQIQSQYESLGGTSYISDEGVSPIASVVGSLDEPEEEVESEEQEEVPNQQQQREDSASTENQFSTEVNSLANDNKYLPPTDLVNK